MGNSLHGVKSAAWAVIYPRNPKPRRVLDRGDFGRSGGCTQEKKGRGVWKEGKRSGVGLGGKGGYPKTRAYKGVDQKQYKVGKTGEEFGRKSPQNIKPATRGVQRGTLNSNSTKEEIVSARRGDEWPGESVCLPLL